jgi:hypothetical protein
MPHDNIIFLDLDGVLICTMPMSREDDLDADGYSLFKQEALDNFKELLEWDASLRIIISSSRRVGKTLEQMEEIFAFRGIKGKVVDMLPVSFSVSQTRGEEIFRYLCDNPIEHFLILDDDYTVLDIDDEEMKNNFVLTEYEAGFDKSKLVEAKMIVKNWR